MIDWSFIITICVIFGASLLGAWLRSRRRDACLVSFNGFHVTLETIDSRRVWGVLEVLPTGLELHYRSAVQDEQHLESSYILYGNEFEQIQTIFRYADDLSPEKQKQRTKAIKRSFHPGPIRKLERKTRNFISAASASLSDILGMALGRARKPAGRFIDETSETHLKQLGDSVIGHVGQQADPLLERLVGTKIVFETIEDGVIHEHVGIFKEYTRDFYEILDVQFPCQEAIPVAQQNTEILAGMEVSANDDVVIITNRSNSPVMLLSLQTSQQEQLLDVVVDPKGEITIYPEFEFTRAVLHARVIRALDIVVPRTRSIIRHRAEVNAKTKLTDLIFDMGMRLPLSNGQQRKEKELRKKLQANPLDACTMSILGGLLLQRQALDEAEELLSQAYAMRFSLPDNGRRVAMHLQELQRRRRLRAVSHSAPPNSFWPDMSIPIQDATDIEA